MTKTTTPMRLTDDERAIFEQHVGLLYKLCRRFHEEPWCYSVFPTWRDCIGAAAGGLASAVRAHDPARGRISTLAYRCIKRALRKAALQEGFVRRTEAEWRSTSKRPRKPRPKVNAGPIAEDWASWTPTDEVDAAEERESIKWAINHARAHLSGRESYIIKRIYFHGQSSYAVARELGVSQPMVCILKKKALARLRRILDDEAAWQRNRRLPGSKRPRPMIDMEREALQAA